MILVADCGSSKITWCLLNKSEVVHIFTTRGMNATLSSSIEMESMMVTYLLSNLEDYPDVITKVYFYGAGCISSLVCGNVARAIRKCVPNADVEVYSDLLGAARALCHHNPGIACILGTGSNSCYFDGKNIVDNVSPLGYILGDEGSGAVLGKILVGDVLKKQIPEPLCEEFLKDYSLNGLSIITHVYRQPQPNRFLASLTPFLIKHIDEPSVHKIVLDQFVAFFMRNIRHYDKYGIKKINFVGSIAYFYIDVLEEAAKLCGYEIGEVIRNPIEGLIEYHKNL